MCSSKSKLQQQGWNMNGRVPVLQPNRVPLLERRNNSSIPTVTVTITVTDDASSKPSSTLFLPPSPLPHPLPSPTRIRSKTTDDQSPPGAKSRPKSLNKSKSFNYTTSYMEYEPGSIAAAQREQVSILHEQRKMKIAHYGRTTTKSKLTPPSPAPPQDHHHHHHHDQVANNFNDKRCTFITPNSDPIYVAYHDHEWGVPVHNDEMLFELLVLTGAQVGSDWTSVLKKRQDFRDAFSGFDVEAVSKYSEKKINGVSSEYRIELSLVRGAVDNSKRILQIKKELGSLDKYLWGFVNHKTMATAYKWSQKIPVKTSKSETISKDMVKRGFRQVGPTVIHSFMQAAGLTNDHLLSCPRHSQINHHTFNPPSPSPSPSLIIN